MRIQIENTTCKKILKIGTEYEITLSTLNIQSGNRQSVNQAIKHQSSITPSAIIRLPVRCNLDLADQQMGIEEDWRSWRVETYGCTGEAGEEDSRLRRLRVWLWRR